MTTIRLTRELGKIIGFSAEGHTGMDEAGEDIVCASVSAVLWCTVNGLESVLGLPVTYETHDAFVRCDIPSLPPANRKQADILLESMVQFLQTLEGQYTEFVKIMEV